MVWKNQVQKMIINKWKKENNFQEHQKIKIDHIKVKIEKMELLTWE